MSDQPTYRPTSNAKQLGVSKQYATDAEIARRLDIIIATHAHLEKMRAEFAMYVPAPLGKAIKEAVASVEFLKPDR